MFDDIVFPAKKSSENNQQYAYRALLQTIMNLDLKPGRQILDTELAEALNVSRTPVREAIVKLLELKLVDVRPQKSSAVSKINLDYVNEGVFIRSLVEGAVIKEAVANITSDELSLLRENLSLQKLRIEEQRFKEYVDLDDRFHKIIYISANKSRTWDGVVMVSAHLDRLRRLQIFAGADTLENGYKEHLKMYDILSGVGITMDLDDFVYHHVTRGFQLVLPKLKAEYPEYFA